MTGLGLFVLPMLLVTVAVIGLVMGSLSAASVLGLLVTLALLYPVVLVVLRRSHRFDDGPRGHASR
jgi:hypothetical protein